ncbi:MAG: hypothetical protein ACODAJ_13550 [Planctomycetota bacterium]
MARTGMWAIVVAGLVAAGAAAGQTYRRPYSPGRRQPSDELTIEEQRELGLSEEQIRAIAEARREVEKEREALDEQLEAARAAARAANAEVARLTGEVRALTTDRLRKIYESVMTPEQRRTWEKQQYLEQARQYLRRYARSLELTDAQVEDIAQLLVPVYEKYDKKTRELEEAREHLADLRKADPLDIEAIEEAEKRVAELSQTNLYRERYRDLREAMRPGLMPDQLEKFGRRYGRR